MNPRLYSEEDERRKKVAKVVNPFVPKAGGGACRACLTHRLKRALYQVVKMIELQLVSNS